MCGRYQAMDEDTVIEMKKIIDEINRCYHNTGKADVMDTGEVYPTNVAPVILADGPRPMRWGYPPVQGSSCPVINTRQETAQTSPYFQAGLAKRRIVVPTAGFYEWMHEGKKATDKFLFRLMGKPLLYLAAIYSPFKLKEGTVEDRFAILTTDANDSMATYHNRMPVYLSVDELETWINDPSCINEILRRTQPVLVATKVKKLEQISMF